MAYDPEQHEIDPKTGFLVYKDTGHRVGVDPAPLAAAEAGVAYPKWVKPHDSHIVRKDDHVSCPLFAEMHIHRVTKEVTVMVVDADEEAVALATFEAPTDGVIKLPKKR